MVAVQRESNEEPSALAAARRRLASLLGRNNDLPIDKAKPVARWQAWAFTTWVLVVSGAYVWTLFRALR